MKMVRSRDLNLIKKKKKVNVEKNKANTFRYVIPNNTNSHVNPVLDRDASIQDLKIHILHTAFCK